MMGSWWSGFVLNVGTPCARDHADLLPSLHAGLQGAELCCSLGLAADM